MVVGGGGGVGGRLALLVLGPPLSVLLSGVGGGGVSVGGTGAESLDDPGGDGALEVRAPEDGHVVGWVAELEQHGQVVRLLGGGGRQGEDGDREDLQHRDMRHLTRGGSLSTRGTQLTLYRLYCAGTDY